MAWLPGQHVTVIAPDGVRRAYSVANAPARNGAAPHIELQVRRVPGGAFSGWWFNSARPNDLLRLQGPQGSFVLGDVASVPLLLLATGTGIAPIKALLEQLAALPAAAQPARIDLYWGGRVQTDLYWDPWSVPQPQSSPLRFTPVLSRATAAWDGARGHVQDAALADIGLHADLRRHQVYACGSPDMVAAARAALQAAGLPTAHFHADAFVCSS
jgi:CDP-4-dehydro-6-deoxyglucose reductase